MYQISNDPSSHLYHDQNGNTVDEEHTEELDYELVIDVVQTS
ncbi:6549_t:CDS:2 [Diversispora eburnea]|uniref:6549_t:CDS:1 n=1 Tax=Diversispora eburnea TaxID=1213867 RepID=A0A9N8V4A6_9GLOM|nr:6549_t:CDS:2 [Diversispora eburnea]